MTVDVETKLAAVYDRIARACDSCGRPADSVRLLAVAKTQPLDLVKRVIKAGCAMIGENYLQELQSAQSEISDNAEWHFIGQLQSKKVRHVVGAVALIHSVDRIKLIKEIEKRAALKNIKVNCLLEINLGDEGSKGGVSYEDTERLMEAALSSEHIAIKGLMSIPPFLPDPEKIRPYHIRLRKLASRLEQSYNIKLPELSMGMSTDMEAAIEEGATIVRVGTDIFGPRNY